MKRSLFVAIFMMVFLTGFTIAGKDRNDLIDMILKPKLQSQCGLHKLSEVERASLCRVFQSLLQSSNLAEGAKAYLENGGWEEVEVLGTRKLKLHEYSLSQEYTIVETGIWTYILEPQTASYLVPGKYLGQMSFTTCEIIDWNGEVVGFWTEDTR